MNQTLTGVVRIVSPPLGALLLEVTSMQVTLAVDMVTAVLAIAPLLFVSVPQPPAGMAGTAGTERRSLLRELGAGLRFVWNWRGMFWLISTAALIRFFLAPAYSFLPLLVTEHFHGGALQLGWMGSAFGVGLICGGLLLSAWGGFRRRMVTCLVGVLSYGTGMLVTGLAPANAFWLALAGSVWRGMMVPVFAGSMDAIYQASVPPGMQGRFFTLNNSVGQLMTPLSLAISGPVADALGVRAVYVSGGVVCILMPIVWAFTPAILSLEDQPVRSGQAERE
jgi:DHA3 family macrolide efflux protein-like MFS transporter